MEDELGQAPGSIIKASKPRDTVMNLQSVRRRLRSAGYDESAIEEVIDRLADEQVQEEKDRAIEENERSLEADGYDLEALERDDPYDEWMYQ